MPPEPHIAVGSRHGPVPPYDIRCHRFRVANGKADLFSVYPTPYPIELPGERNPQARAASPQHHVTYTPVSTAISIIAS